MAAKRGRKVTHGFAGVSPTTGKRNCPTYQIWKAMRQRCNCPTAHNYKHYGGKGVKVCEKWNSFEAFLADVGHRPGPKHSIDRIDNSRGYEPGNCRWATQAEQVRNYCRTKLFTKDGVTLCMKDWAARFGIAYQTLRARIYRGVPFEQAIA